MLERKAGEGELSSRDFRELFINLCPYLRNAGIDNRMPWEDE